MEERNKKGKKMGAEMTDKAKGRATQKKANVKGKNTSKSAQGTLLKN